MNKIHIVALSVIGFLGSSESFAAGAVGDQLSCHSAYQLMISNFTNPENKKIEPRCMMSKLSNDEKKLKVSSRSDAEKLWDNHCIEDSCVLIAAKLVKR